jgi:hypothetical protein
MNTTWVAVLVAGAAFGGGPPEPKTLYKGAGILVMSLESQATIEFGIQAPPSVSVTIKVDRNQNGRIDSRVDTLYARGEDETLCPAFLLGEGHTTFCGEFKTSALLKLGAGPGENGYFIAVPKAELSDRQTSASIILEFWDASSRRRFFYPSSSFKKPLILEYEIR